LSATFESLGLRAELLRALADAGYTTPTPVQAEAIPLILAGRDVLAAAQTGTGKTAGFTMPMLQRLMAAPRPQGLRGPKPVRALIVTPTRELAAQVEESVRTYGRHVPLNSATIFGGVAMGPQVQALVRGVDILVATPGRLLDHVNQRTVDLSRIEIAVLDEADRMLDMGFIHDIRKILNLLPARRQNLLFSATFSDEIMALANRLLNNPARVTVARKNAESELVTQAVYIMGKEDKRDVLVRLLEERGNQQALIFTRTKHGADRVARQLARTGISAVPIHGNRSQPQRVRALSDFKAGAARILVATDIAARGLDIDQLPHVINYELPNVAEDYVHRIGRTGRAGNTGEAISLVSAEELSNLAGIERLLQKRIERRDLPGFAAAQRPMAASAPAPRPTAAPAPAQRPAEPRHDRAPRHSSAPANAHPSRPLGSLRPGARHPR
jgi:ATP-dependent RNA helicase RhlE